MGFLVAGAAILTIGLSSYSSDDELVLGPVPGLTPTEQETAAPPIPLPPGNIRNIDNLPIAIPYYNPFATVRVRAPFHLVIESLGIYAPIVELGMDGDGVPQVPINGQDVAWYDFSAKPGEGSNTVLAGHINWARSPAVFFDLGDLQPGEVLRLIRDEVDEGEGDGGDELVYEVIDNFSVDPTDPESLKVMAPTEEDTITLITCGGTWILDPSEELGGSYDERTIIQARLVRSSLEVLATSAISDN